MQPHVQPDALGRSAEEVGAAHVIALAMYRREPTTSAAKPWLQGMVAASVWILGLAGEPPLTQVLRPATAAALREELLAAGRADMPGEGDPREPGRMFARGAYRMLAYALGLRDELPVRVDAQTARELLRQAS